MPERKNMIKQILDGTREIGSGSFGALIGFILALLLVLFGLWKTLFILLATVLGYLIGVRFFSGQGSFRDLLDKVFPPGLFR